jgi:hypothetical protein
MLKIIKSIYDNLSIKYMNYTSEITIDNLNKKILELELELEYKKKDFIKDLDNITKLNIKELEIKNLIIENKILIIDNKELMIENLKKELYNKQIKD